MKNGLSIDDILKRVWPVDLNNSKAVAVVSARKVKTKGGSPAIAFTTITRLPKQGTHRHKCYVFAADKNYVGPLSKCPAVKLGCDCGRYWSTFEVALHLRGASNIIYSNGAYPYVRNPNAKIACCKHLIKALRLVKARGW